MRSLGPDLQQFLVLLEKHGVRYLVVGGFAVAVHGLPRYTKDLDVWVERSTENAAKIVAAIDEFGFASLGLSIGDFMEPDVVVQLGYEPNRIDLLTEISGVEFEDAYPKRVMGTIDGAILPVIDRASLIANKRASGRSDDMRDVEGLEK